MFWKKKKPAEELPEEIVVPTKKGFKYVFYPKLRKIKIVFDNKLIKPFPKEEFRGVKFLWSVALATFLQNFMHELSHAGMALTLGVEVSNITVPLWGEGYIITSARTAEKSILISLAPSLLEALLGLYLIKQGLKRGKIVYFGYGIATFMRPAAESLGTSLIQYGDFYNAAERLKDILIADFGNNPDVATQISAIGNGPLIFLFAAMVYGTAFFGNKYVPMISEEFITARRTRKLVHQIKEKDYKLYEAMGKKFLWPADRYRKKILGKINPKLLEKE